MKKVFFLILVFSLISIGFSQENISKKDKIVALLEMNNNSKLFTKLVALNIQEIDKDKQLAFRREIAKLAIDKNEEAIVFFMEKYSEDDINAIFTDFSVPNRLAYSQKTLSFMREWKSYKLLFQKEFKKIFETF